MTRFESFSPEALSFLAGLKANNTKDWFTANKAAYERYVKGPGKDFAEAQSAALQDLTGTGHGSKVFRIHRDVRFSKDKTPYNAHLHIAFQPVLPVAQPPMWFFGLSPGKLALGCGVFGYEKQALVDFRAAMAGTAGRDLIALTGDLRAAGCRIAEPELARVPSGFDKDHPNEEALRRKGFAVWIDTDDPAFAVEPDVVARTTHQFARLLPVFRLLSRLT